MLRIRTGSRTCYCRAGPTPGAIKQLHSSSPSGTNGGSGMAECRGTCVASRRFRPLEKAHVSQLTTNGKSAVLHLMAVFTEHASMLRTIHADAAAFEHCRPTALAC